MQKNTWRLLPVIEDSAYVQMAIDESVLDSRLREHVPNTLRFYKWKPKAVSIGCFQSAKQEVNLQELKNQNVDLVRRITGGGAVFHDNELTYSIFIDEKDVENGNDIVGSYKSICTAIIAGLEKIGINAVYSPINDLLIDGRKFSGNAQTRRGSIILQHGTILLDVDVDKMFTLLTPDKEKISDKAVKSVKARVTALHMDFDKVQSALEKGFKKTFSVNLKKQGLTEPEVAKVNLLGRKYIDELWLFKR